MNEGVKEHLEFLITRYPVLEGCRDDIAAAYHVMERAFANGGKLLIAGNGGSAADAEHIAGELMKRFKRPRPVRTSSLRQTLSVGQSWRRSWSGA